MWRVRGFLAVTVVALLLGACSTTGGMPRAGVSEASAAPAKSLRVSKQTATQKAVGKCIASVGFGAVLGAIIGEATGRNAGGGAAVGAVIGAGACAVFLELAAEEDQARLRALEQEAIAANATQTRSFTTKSGSLAQVKTIVVEVPVAPEPVVAASKTAEPKFTACRYASTEVTIGVQSNAAGRQLWCRIETGDWQPVDS